MAERVKIEEFYHKWQLSEKEILEGYLYDEEKRQLKTRYMFSYFLKLLKRFLANEIDETEKIIILTGLRGTGKTTLLAQMYFLNKYVRELQKFLNGKIQDFLSMEKFYLDVSRLHLEEIKLNEFFNFFEETKNISFERLKSKLIIFLDEVQYDEKWGLFLKTIFDRTKGHKNILIIATGSSALKLKLNPDLARRCSFVELFPLKFSEYLILKQNIYPPKNLSDKIWDILNFSSASDIYNFLKSIQDEITRFKVSLPLNIEESFLKYGGFPSGLSILNEQKIMEKYKTLINHIITKDFSFLANITSPTISKIEGLIFLIANSDQISLDKLSQTLKLNYRTVISIIDVLVKSGLMIRISAYGKAYVQTRKTPKLLFLSPSLRHSILNGIVLAEHKGCLLEDYCALIFTKDLRDKIDNVFYDSAEGGADFILSLKDRSKIVIEIGFNKEDISQVANTMKKFGGKFGLVFGSKNLELVNNSIVKIPLEFLLMS